MSEVARPVVWPSGACHWFDMCIRGWTVWFVSASVSGGGVVLYGLHTVLVDLFELRGLAGLPSTVSRPGALVAAVRIFFVGEAGFPNVRHNVVDVAEVSVFGSSGHPVRGSGPKGFESGAEGDGAEELFVADGAPFDKNSFGFPLVPVCHAHYVYGGLQVVLVGKRSSSGTDGSDGEFLVRDLVVFGVVVPGPVSIVASPFDVVEEPAKWFPPNGFEGDPFLVDVLILSVEVVVSNLDPGLRKVTVGNGSSFNSLSSESAFVGREMVKPVLLYVISRELRARGVVWRSVEGSRE